MCRHNWWIKIVQIFSDMLYYVLKINILLLYKYSWILILNYWLWHLFYLVKFSADILVNRSSFYSFRKTWMEDFLMQNISSSKDIVRDWINNYSHTVILIFPLKLRCDSLFSVWSRRQEWVEKMSEERN